MSHPHSLSWFRRPCRVKATRGTGHRCERRAIIPRVFMLDLCKYAANLCRGVFHKISRISFHTYQLQFGTMEYPNFFMNISNNCLAHQMQLPIPKLRILNVHETFYEWPVPNLYRSLDSMVYIVVLYVLHNLYSTHDIFFFKRKTEKKKNENLWLQCNDELIRTQKWCRNGLSWWIVD